MRARVDQTIDGWLAAQNGGDFDAYAALYAESFRGVRRSGDQTVELDREGWLAKRLLTDVARPRQEMSP